MIDDRAEYLAPYERAAEQFGGRFESLLWASQRTQMKRFEVIRRIADPAGKTVLDAGCGRADLLAYLITVGARPRYIGIEGVFALAAAAEAKQYPNATIVHDDFVRHPARLFVGADLVIFSGSLNTIEDDAFYETLRHAFNAAGEKLVFNFLSSSNLAGKDYLRWRYPRDVRSVAEELSPRVKVISDYMDGDCTVCVEK